MHLPKKYFAKAMCVMSVTKVSCHDWCTSSHYSTFIHTCLKTLLISIEEEEVHDEEEEEEEEKFNLT